MFVAGDVGSLCGGGPGHHSAERAHRTPGAHCHHIESEGDNPFVAKETAWRYIFLYLSFISFDVRLKNCTLFLSDLQRSFV
jgi:hypothetical protein